MNRQLNTSLFIEDTADLTADAQRQASYEAVKSVDLSDEDTGLKVSGDKDWEETQRLPPEPPSISVFDVAAYILTKMGPMTTMKLQKLVYYSQAWSLVWDEKPLFDEAIEAWANGPVVRALFNYHRGTYQISSMPIGNPRLLNQEQRDTIDAVLDYYGDKSAQWLIDLTHMEEPWIQTRKGMAIAERGDRVIPLDVIADYYSSLLVEDEENA